MSKELPYFKFVATEWLTGEIIYEPLEVQGLFINICAIYWRKGGVLEISEIERRFKKKSLLSQLTDRFFSLTDGFIRINFLDEQLTERQVLSVTNSQNGKLGGRPLKSEKNRPLSDTKANESEGKAKKSNKEKEEEQEKEEEKNKRERESLEKRISAFGLTLSPFKTEYSSEMLLAFYNYWTEATHSGKKMRFELEKTWDVSRRLTTWASREKTSPRGRVDVKPASKVRTMLQENDIAKQLIDAKYNGQQIGN